MGSQRNQWDERLLAEKLTVAESRLALALGRLLLGWNRSDARLGRALLRETARLDGRSFERARDGLVAKGLIRYTPGTVGRGNRCHYEILTEKAALQRPIEASGKAALQRPLATPAKGRSRDAQKAALRRPRKDRGKGKTPALSAEQQDLNEIRRTAFDAYLSAGGILTLDRERGALARAVRTAATAGTDRSLILAACRDLGRTRDFPGLLKQRIAELVERGGVPIRSPRPLTHDYRTTQPLRLQAVHRMGKRAPTTRPLRASRARAIPRTRLVCARIGGGVSR